MISLIVNYRAIAALLATPTDNSRHLGVLATCGERPLLTQHCCSIEPECEPSEGQEIAVDFVTGGALVIMVD